MEKAPEEIPMTDMQSKDEQQSTSPLATSVKQRNTTVSAGSTASNEPPAAVSEPPTQVAAAPVAAEAAPIPASAPMQAVDVDAPKGTVAVEVPDDLINTRMNRRFDKLMSHRYCSPRSLVIVVTFLSLCFSLGILLAPYDLSLSELLPGYEEYIEFVPGRDGPSNSPSPTTNASFVDFGGPEFGLGYQEFEPPAESIQSDSANEKIRTAVLQGAFIAGNILAFAYSMVYRQGEDFVLQLEVLMLADIVLGFFGEIMITYKNYDVLTSMQVLLITFWAVWTIIVMIIYGLTYCFVRRALQKASATLQRTRALISADQVATYIHRLNMWTKVRQSRKRLRRQFQLGTRCFLFVFILIQLFVGVVVYSEFQQMITTQARYFTEETITYLDSFPGGRPPLRGSVMEPGYPTRVILVVVDGLRYDQIQKNAELNNFVSSIAPDAKVWKLRNQLPSMSVPNWVTLLTGAPPEITGVVGNLLIPETSYDSIFRQAQRVSLRRGLTASPWFAQIIKSTLPALVGDGTLSTAAGSAGRSQSADAADNLRYQVLASTIRPTTPPYGLFLAHFSDVDLQGHCCGVSPYWNKDDTYTSAVNNKTSLLKQIVNLVSYETVVVITSDHGHVDRGGHGGTDDELRDVPLIVYRKGSGFGSVSWGETAYGTNDEDYTNLDIAPTISALMGVPVPRHNFGKFIDPVLSFVPTQNRAIHYRDLYMQKVYLMQEWVKEAQVFEINDPLLTPFENLNTTATGTLVEGVRNLISFWLDQRQSTLTKMKARDFSVSIAVAIVLWTTGLIAFQARTFASFRALFALDKFPQWYVDKNRRAFVLAAIAIVCHFIICTVGYAVGYLLYGYTHEAFESTCIHTIEVLPRWFFTAVGPSIISSYMIFRIINYPWKKVSRDNLPWKLFSFMGWTGSAFDQLDMTYLFRVYAALLTIFFSGIFILIIGAWTYPVPGFSDLDLITELNWPLRFRVATFALFGLLFVVTLFFYMVIWPDDSLGDTGYDPIYRLILAKKGLTSNVLLNDKMIREVGNAKSILDLFKAAKKEEEDSATVDTDKLDVDALNNQPDALDTEKK